jgi:solute carrier family 25, member 33/36
MCGAIVTSPFDVVKTRLQSSMFRDAPVTINAKGTAEIVAQRSGGLLYHFVETGHLLRWVVSWDASVGLLLIHAIRNIHQYEGMSALFKGLGPTLVGVVPARSINFFTYGNGKEVIANQFNGGLENSWVHLSAAAFAGIVTGTATNPIWVIKTRMQLSASHARPYINSWECIKDVVRVDGVRGLYKGLSASYLGVTEGTIQWTLYERLKRLTRNTEGKGGAVEWMGMLGSAGMAKCVASLITYPHEVSTLTLPGAVFSFAFT